jgi:hypothetical protein
MVTKLFDKEILYFLLRNNKQRHHKISVIGQQGKKIPKLMLIRK